jgi:hypothetical protein
MNKLYILSFLLLSACAQLMNGQVQPVKIVDPNKSIYSTTCSGAVEDWGSCSQKASQTCKKSYEVLKRFENPVGGFRELTFQCNK